MSEPMVTDDVRMLALYDPVLAYARAMRIRRNPIVINAVGLFSSSGNRQVDARIDTTITRKTWIQQANYSIKSGSFTNQIFQSLFVSELRQCPAVSVRMVVLSGPRYDLNPNFTPLENFINQFNTRWSSGYVIYPNQTFKIQYRASVGSLVTAATVSFKGYQLEDKAFDSMCREEASAKLYELGIEAPLVEQCKRD